MKSNNDKIKQSLIPTLVKNDSPIKTTPDKNKRLNTPSSCLSDSNSKRSGIPVSIPSKKIIIVEIDPESHILKPTVASKVASIKGIEEEIIGFASPPIIFNEERLIRLTKPTESAVLGAIKYENDKLLVKDEDDPWYNSVIYIYILVLIMFYIFIGGKFVKAKILSLKLHLRKIFKMFHLNINHLYHHLKQKLIKC